MQGTFDTEPEEEVDKDKSAQGKDYHTQEFEAVTGYPSPAETEKNTPKAAIKNSNTDKENNIEKMLTVLNKMTSTFKKNWYDSIDTITEKELDFEIVGLRALLHEINWLKKLSIEKKYDLNSELFKELIRTEKELMAIQNSIKFSDESKDPSEEDSTLDKDGISDKPSPEKESTKGFTGKNNFNNKSYEFIKDHFKEGLVNGEAEYLSGDKLKEWIEVAFGQYPNPPKERYSFKNAGGKKLRIKDVFYQFYVTCGSSRDGSEKYASLCGNYFEGYNTKNVVNTWHKHKNTQTKKNQNK